MEWNKTKKKESRKSFAIRQKWNFTEANNEQWTVNTGWSLHVIVVECCWYCGIFHQNFLSVILMALRILLHIMIFRFATVDHKWARKFNTNAITRRRREEEWEINENSLISDAIKWEFLEIAASEFVMKIDKDR